MHFTRLETVSGKFPYANVQAELAVMKTKLDGTTPVQSSYPELSRDPLWALLKKCWNSKPQSRPQIAQVLAQVGFRSLLHGSSTDGYSRSSTSYTIDCIPKIHFAVVIQ